MSSKSYENACTIALERALTSVLFYEHWRSLDPGPALSISKRYSALPILHKRDIRAHMPRGFTPKDRELKSGLASGEVELVYTSGTTEERSSIVWHQSWWDSSEEASAKSHRDYNQVFKYKKPQAVLTSPLCGGAVCHTGDLPLNERILDGILFLNQKADPNYWQPYDMDRIIEELAHFQPELLEANPSYLALLCRYAQEKNKQIFEPRFIELTYEYSSRLHYRQVRAIFPNSSILSVLGSTETGVLFTECEHGYFHQNSEFCHIDFQPFKTQFGDSHSGRILVTTLNNPWLSLVRFDLGDLIRIASERCPCGDFDGLTAARILGRTRDLTFTMTGRAVTVDELDQIVGTLDTISAYCLEQKSKEDFIFHYQKSKGSFVNTSQLEELLHSLYGSEIQLTLTEESFIAVEQSGKLRLAKSLMEWNPEDLFKSSAEDL